MTRYYYYNHVRHTLTHEEHPQGTWDHDISGQIGTNFRVVKAYAIEDLKRQIKELREALKEIRSLKAGDVRETF